MPKHSIDREFLALPYKRLGEVALSKADSLGVSYADFRFERVITQKLRLRDLQLESLRDFSDTGFCVRVIYKGAWGFAASTELSEAAAAAVAESAIEVAKATARLNQETVEIAPEPSHRATYISAYELNPL